MLFYFKKWLYEKFNCRQACLILIKLCQPTKKFCTLTLCGFYEVLFVKNYENGQAWKMFVCKKSESVIQNCLALVRINFFNFQLLFYYSNKANLMTPVKSLVVILFFWRNSYDFNGFFHLNHPLPNIQHLS